MNDEAGNATLRISYDDYFGYEKEAFAFDAIGKSILVNDGWHKFTAKYDAQGNQTKLAYFDTEGKSTLHKDGYYKATFEYDGRGNVTKWAYFDTEGKPTLHKDGTHKLTAKYDARGNQTEWAYFNTDGKPTLHKDGYHKVTAEYDGRGNQTEWAYFDTSGSPAVDKTDSTHKTIAKYDNRGNVTKWTYFDTEGKLTLHKEWFHKSTAKYDDRGNVTKWAYFDTEGKPTLHKEWFHKSTAEYDDRGNRIETITIKFDKFGNQIEKNRFNEIGNRVSSETAYFGNKIDRKYDDQGKKIGETWFDADGQQIETEIVVMSIIFESQGERLGIGAGDILTHYDDKPVSNFSQFIATRDAEPQNSPPKELKVLRNGKVLTFMLSPGEIGVQFRNRPIPGNRPSSGGSDSAW